MDTKALRQKILDLAIHGKLVPQDPNDEPASVLLQRIREEKERLIKEGKIKKGKKSLSRLPIRPIMRTFRLKCQSRGSGRRWEKLVILVWVRCLIKSRMKVKKCYTFATLMYVGILLI